MLSFDFGRACRFFYSDIFLRVIYFPFYILRTKFEALTKCVTKTLDICDENDLLSQSQILSIVRSSLDENVYCLKGGWKETTSSSGILPCRSSFVTDAKNCPRNFNQRFAS